MCRITDYGGYHPQQRLKITGISVRLSLASPPEAELLPETLTLLLLPRINAAPLHLNGSKISSDSPAFLSLHRLLGAGDTAGAVVFTAGDRLRVSDGLSFELHVAGNRLLKGVFRRETGAGDWTMECKCAGEFAGEFAGEAEVAVEVENGGLMREKVPVMMCRRRRRGFPVRLEDIPEERDECCCCCDESDGEDEFDESDGEDEFGDFEEEKDAEMDGVGWAVDVGFWVMCVGVGFLLSRASSRKFRPRKPLS